MNLNHSLMANPYGHPVPLWTPQTMRGRWKMLLELMRAHRNDLTVEQIRDIRRAMDEARVCSTWLEQHAPDGLRYVGPFRTPGFSRGDRVVFGAGTLISHFKQGKRDAVERLEHPIVVTVDEVTRGWCGIRTGEVSHATVIWNATDRRWTCADANAAFAARGVGRTLRHRRIAA